MRIRSYKWISVFLLALVIVSGIGFVVVIRGYFELTLELGAVRGECELIESLWVPSKLSDPHAAAEALLRLKEYHQSISPKQGSNADKILKLHKRSVEREIIQFLRNKTGQDLGDEPDKWIKNYATLGANPTGQAHRSLPVGH